MRGRSRAYYLLRDALPSGAFELAVERGYRGLLAAAGLVLGLLLGIGLLPALGFAFAAGCGLPFWLLELASGGEFAPTSLLTHVLGLALGLVALAWAGLPGGVWWKALLAVALLQEFCRWATPAASPSTCERLKPSPASWAMNVALDTSLPI